MQKIKKELFDVLTYENGEKKEIYLYTLENNNKMKASFFDLGAANYELIVPDKNGNLIDVSLQYKNIEDIYDNKKSLGAIVARNCNRIENGIAKISNVEYKLEVDKKNNNLHSGPDVFRKKMTECTMLDDNNNSGEASLLFSYHFKDIEQGFPGEMDFSVKYTLNDKNELIIIYSAVSDKDSIFNPTSHMYFNLSGHDKNDLSNHELIINSEKVVFVKDNFIPKEAVDVKNTVFDFNDFKNIHDRLEEGMTSEAQVKLCNGFDHCFIINKNSRNRINIFNKELYLAATALSKDTSIKMDIYTDSEAIQFYTANFIDVDVDAVSKSGLKYKKQGSFCLETEFVPNSINDDRFKSPLIKAGINKDFTTILKFGA